MMTYLPTVPRFLGEGPLPMPRRTRRIRLNPPAAPLPPFHAWRA